MHVLPIYYDCNMSVSSQPWHPYIDKLSGGICYPIVPSSLCLNALVLLLILVDKPSNHNLLCNIYKTVSLINVLIGIFFKD